MHRHQTWFDSWLGVGEEEDKSFFSKFAFYPPPYFDVIVEWIMVKLQHIRSIGTLALGKWLAKQRDQATKIF